VLVSRTVDSPAGGGFMHAVVAAATGLDAEFVLVWPDRTIARMQKLPHNVRTVEWIPLNHALPGATAIVHHGGAGTVLAALGAGIPQLMVPGAGDRRTNAALVAKRGAGLAATAREITADLLQRLITDGSLRTTAAEVRDEMAAMPAPKDVAERLEQLPVA
jgi:UDP:flavonoid glycosyltransferase YjiC (YdhE family)